MQKFKKKEQQAEDAVVEYLRKIAESEPIPEKLKPQEMEAWLANEIAKKEAEEKAKGEETTGKSEGETKGEEAAGKSEGEAKREETTGKSEGEAKGEEAAGKAEEKGTGGRKRDYRRWWGSTIAVAACLAVVLFAAGRSIDWEGEMDKLEEMEEPEYVARTEERFSDKEEDGEAAEGSTYQELYQAFSEIWKKQEGIEVYQEERVMDSAGAKTGETFSVDADAAAGEMAEGGEMKMEASTDTSADSGGQEGSGDYGKTNQQEENVEEADIIKNDGRYLYQVIRQDRNFKYAVQIADTKDGLKEVAKIGDFDNEINNIYLWNDTLVVIESGWVNDVAEEAESGNPLNAIKGFVEDIFSGDQESGYRETAYSKIHVYNIKDRANPEEYHVFTVKGNYQDSRISDGYLYFFSVCNAFKPRLEKDYQAYIPEIDGEILSPDKIYLPDDTDTASYLVMASINMEQPDKFTDTTAVVTAADKFYVSQSNIYITDNRYVDAGAKGVDTDRTRIYRYSYQDGKMKREAEGTVKGTLRDDMAMNEYKGYLRMVATVEQQNITEVKDDITGEVIGYDSLEFETYNNLYVLDEDLKIAGKIENLAEDELVYSARFMGEAGYFVTFRQTDPLFSVDLSNPKKPKILGELKISGFSEYLHFYSENLLLGIGMEADEDTGSVEGMKLSMFDISNPSDVKEQSKLHLPDYDYADALYNYKAVLIDTDKNLFGFHAQGYHEDDYKYDYLLFTFEDGKFKEIMNIDCSDSDLFSGQVRGTYIGDRFYLMCTNGRIEAYSLKDGNKLAELVP